MEKEEPWAVECYCPCHKHLGEGYIECGDCYWVHCCTQE